MLYEKIKVKTLLQKQKMMVDHMLLKQVYFLQDLRIAKQMTIQLKVL